MGDAAGHPAARYLEADLLVFAGIFSIAGLGIGLLLGHCGIASLAQGMFYGLGAYNHAPTLTVDLGLSEPGRFGSSARLSRSRWRWRSIGFGRSCG